MEDLISRKAAIDAAEKIIERDTSGGNIVVNAMIAWAEYIKGLPSAKPKKGQWNWIVYDIECSLCGFQPCFDSTEPLYNYCPNCGAKMEASK